MKEAKYRNYRKSVENAQPRLVFSALVPEIRPRKSRVFSQVFSGISYGLILLLATSVHLVINTSAAFTDDSQLDSQGMGTGHWIPVLDMTVDPEHPDGDDGFYKTTPCVTLSYSGLSSGTATIYYEFSDDGNPVSGGEEYHGTCVHIPDGDPTHFQAIAVNDANDNWKSDLVSKDFKVNTEPEEEIHTLRLHSDANDSDNDPNNKEVSAPMVDEIMPPVDEAVTPPSQSDSTEEPKEETVPEDDSDVHVPENNVNDTVVPPVDEPQKEEIKADDPGTTDTGESDEKGEEKPKVEENSSETPAETGDGV